MCNHHAIGDRSTVHSHLEVNHTFLVQKRRRKSKMEEEVCNYQKFGFCKFEDKCQKKHLKVTCHDLSVCAEIKTCQKRHPRRCKRHALEGFCGFRAVCAYHHQDQSTQLTKNSNTEMNKKVEDLEKIIHEMAEKMVTLEN